jgi:Ca2+/Na+ antiporter
MRDKSFIQSIIELQDEYKLLTFFMTASLLYVSVHNQLNVQHGLGLVFSLLFLVVLIELTNEEEYNLNKELENKTLHIQKFYPDAFENIEPHIHNDGNVITVLDEIEKHYGYKNKNVMEQIVKYVNFILYTKSKLEKENDEVLNQAGEFRVATSKLIELEGILISLKPSIDGVDMRHYNELSKRLITLLYRQLDVVKVGIDKKIKEYHIPDILPDYDYVKLLKK